MLTRVLETIKENSMLKAGDNVVCAVSGGADSMALLCVLYEIKDELGINVYAAHLNHSIRGEAAESDYLFVKGFCEKKGIELFYKKVDIPCLAKQRHKSEEEVGREERYRLFFECAERLGGAKIATGHHKNDRVETVLFNLFRGSGARGLKGIPYKRGNIIRPLLDVSRKDTETYLESKGVKWCEDATNKECVYSRNRIRLVVLKEIEKIFPDAVRKIAAASDAVGLDDEYLTALSRQTGAFEDGVIYKEKFLSLHPSLQRRVALDALEQWGVSDISADKIKIVTECALGDTGKYRDLGDDVRIENSYGKIKKVSDNDFSKSEEKYIVPYGESLEITAFEGVWSIKTVDKTEKIRDNKMMIFLDADKIARDVCIRCRKDGDFIAPFGMVGTKKLKKVFIDLKIPTEKRDKISMLTTGSEILFIPGIRKTGNYLPDKNTKKILIAEYKRK